jgi:hypothetical protein
MQILFVIVLLNRLLALIAYHSHSFGILIKGRPEIIVENGDLIPSTMLRNHISTHSLEACTNRGKQGSSVVDRAHQEGGEDYEENGVEALLRASLNACNRGEP